MYNFFMFLPRCFFYAISMGGWDWFPKKQTDGLPEEVHYIRLALSYGISFKALEKEATKILGADLQNTVEIVGGCDIHERLTGGSREVENVGDVLEHCQGIVETQSHMFWRPGPRTVSLFVDGDVAVQLENCKCFTISQHSDSTEDAVNVWREHRLERFLITAMAVLQSSGDLDQECPECNHTLSVVSDVDSYGDCRRCDHHLIDSDALKNTAEKLSKEAA